MSEKIVCYLCGSEASQKGEDVGRRRNVSCSNDECVEYELTMEAMPFLKSCSEKIKQHLQKKAKKHFDEELKPLLITKTEVESPS